MSSAINIERLHSLQQEAKQLLKELIVTPSFSKEENATATIIEQFLIQRGVQAHRILSLIHISEPTRH